MNPIQVKIVDITKQAVDDLSIELSRVTDLYGNTVEQFWKDSSVYSQTLGEQTTELMSAKRTKKKLDFVIPAFHSVHLRLKVLSNSEKEKASKLTFNIDPPQFQAIEVAYQYSSIEGSLSF